MGMFATIWKDGDKSGSITGVMEPDASPAPPADPDPDPAFFELWGRVVGAWDDDRAHAAFLEYAIASRKMPQAAACYRSQTEVPERSELAKKKLSALVIAATAMLESMRTPRPQGGSWKMTLVAALVASALVGLLLYAMCGR